MKLSDKNLHLHLPILFCFSPGQNESLCQGKPYYIIRKEIDLNKCLRRPVFQQWVGLESRCDENSGSCQGLFTVSFS